MFKKGEMVMGKGILGFVLGIIAALLVGVATGSIQVNEYPLPVNERLTSVQDRLKGLEEWIAEMELKDEIVIVYDSTGFTESGGPIRLEGYQSMRRIDIYNRDGTLYTTDYEYIFNDGPIELFGKQDSTKYTIQAVKGSTVKLTTTGTKGGPIFMGHYACYTNSSHCMADIKATPFQVQ